MLEDVLILIFFVFPCQFSLDSELRSMKSYFPVYTNEERLTCLLVPMMQVKDMTAKKIN